MKFCHNFIISVKSTPPPLIRHLGLSRLLHLLWCGLRVEEVADRGNIGALPGRYVL